MNAMQPRSSFQCDEPVGCCPPGHQCWFCMQDTIADALVDLLLNDPDLLAILNAPRMGVVDGSVAQPGQVGEWVTSSVSITIPAIGAGQTWGGLASVTLPAGDWMIFPDAVWQQFYPSVAFGLSPPPGFSTGMLGGSWGAGDPNNRIAIGQPAHASIAAPMLLNFSIAIGAAGATGAGNYTQRVQAIRLR